MSEQDGSSKGFKDPSAPKEVHLKLPDGKEFIDFGETAMNHIESQLPRVDSHDMRQGDVLTVGFDNDFQEIFKVAKLQTGSLVFGSDDVRRQQVILRCQGETDEPQTIRLYGSAVSPSGGFITSDVVRKYSYMMTDKGPSTSVISSFDLKRPDEFGELQPVVLNKEETKETSDSFSKVKQTYGELSTLLKKAGYSFDQKDEDGLYDRFSKVTGDYLICAARQGFACKVVPQDEIYVYDAKAQVLRGLRNIPTQGIMQAVVVTGVSKDIFQKAGIGYRDDNTPDWRQSWLDGSAILRMSGYNPVTSYTWLSPGQEEPIITVLEYGKNVSKLFQVSKQKGAAFEENKMAHGGEGSTGSSQSLDVDSHGRGQIFDSLEVNIYPGEGPKVEEDDDSVDLWGSCENAAAFRRRVQEKSSISYQKDGAVLIVDGCEIPITTDIGQEIDKLPQVARLALGASQRVGTVVGRSAVQKMIDYFRPTTR